MSIRYSRQVPALACVAAMVTGGGPLGGPSQDGRVPLAAASRAACAVDVTRDVPVPMRDGTILRADVYRPRTSTRVPVILYRTQYGKADAQTSGDRYASPSTFAAHCYLVVSEDIRGMYASGGVFSEYTHDQQDGYDSVEWAAKLPGSTGRVGMYGSSYVGATQWLAAEAAPPHLATIVPTNTSADYDDGWTYENGAYRLNFILPWAMEALVPAAALNRGDKKLAEQLHAQQRDLAQWMGRTPYNAFPPFHPGDPKVAPDYFAWIAHRANGPYWQRWAPNQHYPNIKIPVLDVEGWYDAFLAGGVDNFTGMRARSGSDAARTNQRLVVGPWDHVGWGRPDSMEAPLLKAIGPVANSPINELMLAWWDHYLKGVDNGVGGGPRAVSYFEMGANVWRTATSWPLPGTEWRRYYLSSDGHANSVFGDGALVTGKGSAGPGADHYRYDPANPVPSVGGHSCCAAPVGSQGPYDQQAIEQRPDVLVYTTPKLAQPVAVTGPVSVSLYAASSAPDTDWTAKLVVVRADGSAVNLNNGIVRASFRESGTRPSPIRPGAVYQYTIQVWPTSYRFAAGDQIRLEVSSSDYPQFDPNPNTGSWAGQDSATKVAQQTVLHDAAHPSALVLPVVPDTGPGSASFPMSTR
jgi:putative CocE/NonD family hydrolase